MKTRQVPTKEVLILSKQTFKLNSVTDGIQSFDFEHHPHLALLTLTGDRSQASSLMLSSTCLTGFNPISLQDLNSVKIGDKIRVTTDIKNAVWHFWDPPEFLLPLNDIDQIMVVIDVVKGVEDDDYLVLARKIYEN